jgi:hypothetical protein
MIQFACDRCGRPVGDDGGSGFGVDLCARCTGALKTWVKRTDGRVRCANGMPLAKARLVAASDGSIDLDAWINAMASEGRTYGRRQAYLALRSLKRHGVKLVDGVYRLRGGDE